MFTAAITTEGVRDEYFNAKWCCRFSECVCDIEAEELAPEGTKYEATSFSQDFSLGNGKLAEKELFAMQTIYESYTSEFVDEEITTSCFVNYLSYQDNDASLYLGFTLLFESEDFGASNYNILFQDWATQHSSEILEDLQTLGGWNVTNMTDPVSAFSMEGPPTYESIQSSSESSSAFSPTSLFFLLLLVPIAVGIATGIYCFQRRKSKK